MSLNFTEISENDYKSALAYLALHHKVRMHLLTFNNEKPDETISFLPENEENMIDNILLKSTQKKMLLNGRWEYQNIFYKSDLLADIIR